MWLWALGAGTVAQASQDSEPKEVTTHKLPCESRIQDNSSFLFHTPCPTRFLLKYVLGKALEINFIVHM